MLGLQARFKAGGELKHTAASGLRTEFSGVPPQGREAFYGYKGLGNGLSMQPDLLKKIEN